jgi:uncharacterized membrane protein
MLVARKWSGLLAGLGLVASLGMALRFPALLQAVELGEVVFLKPIPVIFGVALLLIASLMLLVRGRTRGKVFAVSAGLLLISRFRMPTIDFSFWLWLALLVALAGAFMGFRRQNVPKPEA